MPPRHRFVPLVLSLAILLPGMVRAATDLYAGVWASSGSGPLLAGDVARFSAVDGSFLGVAVPSNLTLGVLDNGDVAFGPDGNLYMPSVNGGVHRFSAAGADLGTLIADHPQGWNYSNGLAFAPDGSLLLMECDANDTTGAILRYGADGSLLGTFVAPGSGGMICPEDLTFGPDGNLYVVDASTSSNSARIHVFNGSTGAFVRTAGGSFNRYSSVAFGADGVLYVSSHAPAPTQLTRIDPRSGNVIEVLPYGGGGTTNFATLVRGPDGALYFSSADASAAQPVIRFDAIARQFAGFVLNSNPADVFNLWRMTFGPCATFSTSLCAGERYRIRASFHTEQGQNGQGRAVQLTPDSGYFWFFDPANTEVVVKVLDGCALNHKHWVFVAGMTNVQVALTVTDTDGTASKTYNNALGATFKTILDTAALPCP